MAEEQENIPIEVSIQPTGSSAAAAPEQNPSVASVAAATLSVMPEKAQFEGPVIKKQRTIKPKPKVAPASGVAMSPGRSNPKTTIANMKRDLEEGRRRLKPEELNNPFSKEFNKLLLKKELLEREMTIHDIGLLPDDGDGAAAGRDRLRRRGRRLVGGEAGGGQGRERAERAARDEEPDAGERGHLGLPR